MSIHNSVQHSAYQTADEEKHGISGLFNALNDFVFNKKPSPKPKKDIYWQSLIDAIDSNVIVCSGMRVVAFNQNFFEFAELNTAHTETLLINKFLHDTPIIHDILSDEQTTIETTFLTCSDAAIPVEIVARTVEYNGITKRIIEVRDIRERKSVQESVYFLSNYDPLTQLPNREFLKTHLHSILDDRPHDAPICTLIKISVEMVPTPESANREDIYNQWVKATAAHLRAEAPTDAFVAHLSGTEFGVLCQNLPDVTQARLIGQQLRRQMNKPTLIANFSIETKASVGLATAPEDATTVETLMKYAALTLAAARKEGTGRCKYFSPSLTLEFERRNVLIEHLPRAIANGEIQTYFQAVLHAHDTSVAAFEALVRWHHPEFGVIPPFEFLDIAEQKGLMTPLTEVVLNAALDATHVWPDDVRVCVNVSPQQLNNHLIDQVRDALKAKSVDPKRLEIEVTEDVIINDFAHAASIFSRLRAMGVQVAMDDFGAGYTSLGNLRYLNFDRIKIDRIFTMDLPNHRRVAAVVRALFVLARELDISLTVEGVETAEQYEFLKNEGDCELQGFYFCKPKPLHELADLQYLQINKDKLQKKKSALIMPKPARIAG